MASVESLTRPRLAVAFVSVIAAASLGYYAYQNHARSSDPSDSSRLPGRRGLRRSNAIRRTRRHQRIDSASSTSSSAAGDENFNTNFDAPADDAPGAEGAETGEVEEWWNDGEQFPPPRAGHNIVTLLFRVSEDNARRNGCVHRGCQCNSCGVIPIRGIRYRCANCADFDLCEACEAQQGHFKTHIFYKVRVPAPPFGARNMQPVWYTGDPDTCHRNLPKALIGQLSRLTGFERPELEAFWEQWTYMACTDWREDPDGLGLAMDRKTFERCLVPTGGSRHAAPNLIHDRMFAFYDYNQDGLIGFSEFLVGLSYRRQHGKLRKVFEGYDIDGDGYVSRRDFLHMFRAYYVLYKQMHRDIIDGLKSEALASQEVHGLVTGRQPLSSHFGREGRIPNADSALQFQGKTFQSDGSVVIAEGQENVVVEDETDTAPRGDVLTSLFACETAAVEQQARTRLVISDDNTDWRTVFNSVNPSAADRAYARVLLSPPASLDGLPDLLDSNSPEDDADDHGVESADPSTESQTLAGTLYRNRRQAMKREAERRNMARSQMHERWKRRQFYLDEEEGASAPDDWNEAEDILDHPSQARVPPRRLSGPIMPQSEVDAGTEILYQVTQQAFNELLDSIFKRSEDEAAEAAATRASREKFKHILETVELDEPVRDDIVNPEESIFVEMDQHVLEEEGLNAEEIAAISGIYAGVRAAGDQGDGSGPEPTPVESTEPIEHIDFTMPQFRPNSDASDPRIPQLGPSYPLTGSQSGQAGMACENGEAMPSTETLRRWKELEMVEDLAAARGGWGRLNYEEFEAIYNEQEAQGNRLDYLGSWIDFCIR